MKRAVPTVLLLALLAGCGGGGHTAAKPSPSVSPSATVSASPQAGPDEFVAEARQQAFGNADFAGSPAESVLEVGRTVCDGFDQGLSYGRVVQGLVTSNAKPRQDQAEELTRTAVKNLCPENTASLP
jgi:hypothetical protein